MWSNFDDENISLTAAFNTVPIEVAEEGTQECLPVKGCLEYLGPN